MLSEVDETVDGLTEALLVFAGRNQHLHHVVRPQLAAGVWVVCDRFTDATYAYQGGARGVDTSILTSLEAWVQDSLQPDLTLLLDLDPKIALGRIAHREKDRLEQERLEFYQVVRQVYLDRADRYDRFRCIDASQPLDAVGADVDRHVQEFLAQTLGQSK